MKTIALFLLLTGVVRADVIQLTGGKILKGQVMSLAGDMFEVMDRSNQTTRLPANTVVGIDFTRGWVPATLDLQDGSQLIGKVWLFARGAFNYQNSEGETRRIPAPKISKISFGEAPPAPPDPPRPVPSPTAGNQKIHLISQGERVDVVKHCEPGKITVVDFYADWCGPCRQVAPVLERYVKGDPELNLRKIDIVNWGSPVAEQYGIRGVPAIRVYDRKGRLVGEFSGFNEARFQELLRKAKAS